MKLLANEVFCNSSIKKIINKRKKIITMIMAICMVFSSYANKNLYSDTEITLDLKNTTIIGVLDYIESTTELRFIFDSEIYDLNEKVSLSIKNKSLDETLFTLFGSKVIYQLKLH